MKILFPFLVILFATSLSAQQGAKDGRTFRNQISIMLNEIHANIDKFSPRDRGYLRIGYNHLAINYNEAFEDGARMIARGYLTKNIRSIKNDPDFKRMIAEQDAAATIYLQDITTMYYDRVYGAEPTPNSWNLIAALGGIGRFIPIISHFEKKAKTKACGMGHDFYEKVYWPSYEAASGQAAEHFNVEEVLGRRCGKLLSQN